MSPKRNILKKGKKRNLFYNISQRGVIGARNLQVNDHVFSIVFRNRFPNSSLNMFTLLIDLYDVLEDILDQIKTKYMEKKNNQTQFVNFAIHAPYMNHAIYTGIISIVTENSNICKYYGRCHVDNQNVLHISRRYHR